MSVWMVERPIKIASGVVNAHNRARSEQSDIHFCIRALLPLSSPIFFGRFCFHFTPSHGTKHVVYFVFPWLAMIKSVRFGAFVLATPTLFAVRPVHVAKPSSCPSSTDDPRPCLRSMPCRPAAIGLYFHRGFVRFEPHSSFQFFNVMFLPPFVAVNVCGLPHPWFLMSSGQVSFILTWNRCHKVLHSPKDCSCWSSDFRPRSFFPTLALSTLLSPDPTISILEGSR